MVFLNFTKMNGQTTYVKLDFIYGIVWQSGNPKSMGSSPVMTQITLLEWPAIAIEKGTFISWFTC